jgi:hypothetical protein
MRGICATDFLHVGRSCGGKTHRGVAYIAEHFLGRDHAITTYLGRHPAVRWCPRALRSSYSRLPLAGRARFSIPGTWTSITHFFYTTATIFYRDLILLHDLHITSNGGKLPIDLKIVRLDYVFKCA